MEVFVLAAHVLLAAAIIALVLLQQGKGAEAGAAFGSGASQTVFGSQGSGSFLGKLTALMAAGLFATSFILAVYAKQQAGAVQGAGIPSEAVVKQVEQSALPEIGSEDAPRTEMPADADMPTTEQ